MNQNYTAIRERVALVDYQDEGRFIITGKDFKDFINNLAGEDLDDFFPGQVCNTVLLKGNGSLLAIVWIIIDQDRIIIFSEPEDKKNVFSHLEKAIVTYDAVIEDISMATCCFAVVGPLGEEVMLNIIGDDIVGLSYLRFDNYRDDSLLLTRIGYVGEYECRIVGPVEEKSHLESEIIDAGKSWNMIKADQSAHPLMMMEMRSVNQKRDILPNKTLVQAGLQWMVNFRKKGVTGLEFLREQLDTPESKLVLLEIECKDETQLSVPADIVIDDIQLGELIRCHYSPILGRLIGFAYIHSEFSWPGIKFGIKSNEKLFYSFSRSAPLFLTKTIINSMNY